MWVLISNNDSHARPCFYVDCAKSWFSLVVFGDAVLRSWIFTGSSFIDWSWWVGVAAQVPRGFLYVHVPSGSRDSSECLERSCTCSRDWWTHGPPRGTESENQRIEPPPWGEGVRITCLGIKWYSETFYLIWLLFGDNILKLLLNVSYRFCRIPSVLFLPIFFVAIHLLMAFVSLNAKLAESGHDHN